MPWQLVAVKRPLRVVEHLLAAEGGEGGGGEGDVLVILLSLKSEIGIGLFY